MEAISTHVGVMGRFHDTANRASIGGLYPSRLRRAAPAISFFAIMHADGPIPGSVGSGLGGQRGGARKDDGGRQRDHGKEIIRSVLCSSSVFNPNSGMVLFVGRQSGIPQSDSFWFVAPRYAD